MDPLEVGTNYNLLLNWTKEEHMAPFQAMIYFKGNLHS